jgi:translation initiation factor IF-3
LPIAQNLRCNEQIRLSPIRLIDENNGQVGVISTDEALRRAREAGLDLVEVAPTERPPVCRIMDYGKWKYQQKKKHKTHHREQQLKEVRLSPKTDDHDKGIKVNRARDFLGQGDKVQFTMVFRGRERFHQDRGLTIFREILEDLGETAKVERPPKMEGRRMTMVLSPDKPAAKPASKPKAPASNAGAAPVAGAVTADSASPSVTLPPPPSMAGQRAGEMT